MALLSRVFAIAATAALLSAPRALAQDAGTEAGTGEEAAAPAKPPELFEQVDRKRTMSMKLPRTWKTLTGEEANPAALASFGGAYGEEGKSPGGQVDFFTYPTFQRAGLARAVLLPQSGAVKPDSIQNEPGWAQGCAGDGRIVRWYRFVEKGGRVYGFVVYAEERSYDAVRATAEALLATAKVPGEATTPSLGEGFTKRKSGDYDVTSDAEASRDGSVKKACESLGTARDIAAKALPGKPFDASRPVAWIFQNATKFEDRAKAAGYAKVEGGIFNAADRAAMVSILSENAQGNDQAVYRTGASQYLWQYFGGSPPIWVDIGLRDYAMASALGGGKKMPPEIVSQVKTAIAAGKRRLDQWFDVVSTSEIKDDLQGAMELLGWHAYFRIGKGSKKLRKNYDAYLQTLRDSGDPAVARKAFDGVNFDEVLQDFKSWGNDWKP